MNDAPLFKLAHSLAGIGMDYSTAGLKDHVLKGQSHAHRILTGHGNERFHNYQEITEFTWFLLARSADKNCFLIATAEVDFRKIYQGRDWEFEFDRTISRIVEMSQV